MNKKLIISVVICLVILTSVSLVVAYNVSNKASPSIGEAGALTPTPEEKARGIVEYSNPRYKDGSMINWQSKR